MKMDRVFDPAASDSEFARLLEAELDQNNLNAAPSPGEWVTGTIDTISKSYAFLNLGCKAEGFIEIAELTDEEGNLTHKAGDTLKACVIGFDRSSGGARLSLKLQSGQTDPSLLREAARFGLPVSGKVTESIKGGFNVDLAGQRAFCPLSQMDTRRVNDPADYLEQTLDFAIIQYENDGRNIVVSRRKLLEEKAAEIIKGLVPGTVVEGRISEVRDYGAMMELGAGMDGMIHVSELSHSRVNRPSDVISVGDQVEALVLEADPERLRVSLSLKALQEDPWKQAARELTPGLGVEGIITGMETFGAFVELLPGINGLLHISAMGKQAGRRIRHPRDLFSMGDTIQVEIEGVDPVKQRISLSLPPAGEEAGREGGEFTGGGGDQYRGGGGGGAPGGRGGARAAARGGGAPSEPVHTSMGTLGDLFAKQLNQTRKGGDSKKR